MEESSFTLLLFSLILFLVTSSAQNIYLTFCATKRILRSWNLYELILFPAPVFLTIPGPFQFCVYAFNELLRTFHLTKKKRVLILFSFATACEHNRPTILLADFSTCKQRFREKRSRYQMEIAKQFCVITITSLLFSCKLNTSYKGSLYITAAIMLLFYII